MRVSSGKYLHDFGARVKGGGVANAGSPLQSGPVRFYNEFRETRKTRSRLPHWQQDGAAFFVSYRLDDSIPAELMEKSRGISGGTL